MKRIIPLLMLAFIFSGIKVSAQNPAYSKGLSFKALFMDYQSQNGGDITKFNAYHHGFEMGYHMKLQDNVNLVIPFKMGVVSSHEEVDCLHKTIYGLDAQVQYQFYKPNAKVVPYIMGGIGGVSEKGGEFNLQAPVGFGLNFRIAPNAFVNWQSTYRYSFSVDRNNLHHGIGFVYLWDGMSKEEKKEMPIAHKDSDGDGIFDDVDLCPQAAGPQELNGCPDKDGDGIADFEDKCPEIKGTKALKGCPDSDGDGVADNDDECPNVAGLASNKGCPKQTKDRDGDGVNDDRDLCPDIPGSPTNAGCPSDDKDNDGIKDNLDRCPNDPGPAATKGCPDSDGDGIPDYEDKCPNAAGPSIYGGCPDTDGDGIDDGRDRCPNSPGPVSSNGCPEISKEDRETLDIAMRAVQFDTGKSTLKWESNSVLNQIAEIMNRYPDYNLSISGHTDNTGSARANQQLSERRAKACYEYLISRNVSASRMNYAGYGESKPIANNSSLKGRALNRRTEFNLIPR